MQDCSNSIANALELLLSCTKPSITPCALMIPIVQYHYTLCRGFPFNRASHGSHRSTNQWIHCQIIGCLSTKVRSQINHTVYIHVAKYMTPTHDDVMKLKYFPRYWLCAVPGEFPTQRPVTRSFDVFFDLRLNKRLSKQSWGWWFETPLRPLWRHGNVTWPGIWPRPYFTKYFPHR